MVYEVVEDCPSSGDRQSNLECFKYKLPIYKIYLAPHIWSVAIHQTGLSRKTSEAEAANLRFVKKHTSVSVPRVWLHFSWGRASYIVMDRVRGVTLVSIWERLGDEQRSRVVSQLSSMILDLRSLATPYGPRICSAAGAHFEDGRLSRAGVTGPFDDEDEFIAYMEYDIKWPDIVRTGHAIRHPIVFTHGDLGLRNIMVDGKRGDITGIVDWQNAGWFPAHWEYCKARFSYLTEQWVCPSWAGYLPLVVPPFKLELEADEEMIRITGVPWVQNYDSPKSLDVLQPTYKYGQQEAGNIKERLGTDKIE